MCATALMSRFVHDWQLKPKKKEKKRTGSSSSGLRREWLRVGINLRVQGDRSLLVCFDGADLKLFFSKNNFLVFSSFKFFLQKTSSLQNLKFPLIPIIHKESPYSKPHSPHPSAPYKPKKRQHQQQQKGKTAIFYIYLAPRHRFSPFGWVGTARSCTAEAIFCPMEQGTRADETNTTTETKIITKDNEFGLACHSLGPFGDGYSPPQAKLLNNDRIKKKLSKTKKTDRLKSSKGA